MTFDVQEANARLQTIIEMVDVALLSDSISVSVDRLLRQISAVAQGADEVQVYEPQAPRLDHIIMSCDASIKENPGGPSAVGVVVQLPGYPEKTSVSHLSFKQETSAVTNNQAEYDAIYFGLTTFMARHNNPQCLIEVRSDSQLVIKQLNGDISCQDKELQRRRDVILELIKELPVPVMFVWRPRNSTLELKQANYLAQDLLGVPRH